MLTNRIDKDDGDELLLTELQNGNEKAFEVLFHKYYKNLCRFAFSFTHETDISQSLVQNVFVKIWERRNVLGHVESLVRYLTTMVRNECALYLKRKNIDSRITKIIATKEVDNSTEQKIFSDDFEEQFLRALAKLPPRCRTAFEYSRFESMSNKEIAVAMGISIKGIEALIGRSLKLLRKDLVEFLPSYNSGNNNPLLLFLNFRKKIMFLI